MTTLEGRNRMVMEFDQYLQPVDVTDSRYLAVYQSLSKARPPLVDVYRAAAAAADGPEGARPGSGPPDSSPAGPKEEDEAAGAEVRDQGEDQDGDDGGTPTRQNRCTWDCNFDNDDAETILTSHTVRCLLNV